MKAHILITNNETFSVCRDRLFWGIGTPNVPSNFEEWINPKNSRKPYLKMLVDMLGVDKDDLIFLYERQVGFHGIYKAKSELFFDATKITNEDGFVVDEKWPLRILLESVYFFPKPVPEDLLFSTPRYENVFWIWAYRKNQGPRGCNTITPEATEALIELLVKVNSSDAKYDKFDSYKPSVLKPINLSFKKNGEKVVLEDFLRGYILQNLKSDDLKEIFGPKEDIEWYANNVPYHITRKNIDILIFHKNFKYTNAPLRYKYSVVELKKDVAKSSDISQLIRYAQWAGGRLAGGETEMIQSILIASDFTTDCIKKAQEADFNERGIKLFQYIATKETEIKFKEIK